MNIDLKKINILVIEDIIPMQQLIMQMLHALGVGSVSTARNGAEGYRIYLQKKPDIIITDWQMPEMNGLELIKKIRLSKESTNRTIPIIMITGYNSKDRISLARDTGCTEFLIKPFAANDLATRITHIIKKPRDFILTPQFAGPDRRRRPDDNYKGKSSRTTETKKKIIAKKALEKKTGSGIIHPEKIKTSQKVLDGNKIDFVPIANGFINNLETALKNIGYNTRSSKLTSESLVTPIMQLKANAFIFKHDLVGELSTIMLNFLENLNQLDEYVIEIVNANKNTLKHLINNEIKSTNSDTAQNLKNELTNACQRYMNIKSHISKNKLKAKIK